MSTTTKSRIESEITPVHDNLFKRGQLIFSPNPDVLAIVTKDEVPGSNVVFAVVLHAPKSDPNTALWPLGKEIDFHSPAFHEWRGSITLTSE